MGDRSSRKLAAVWFADIVGYTALSSRDEARALELVAILKSVGEAAVGGRGGRVVKHLGDAVMAEFPSGEAAVEAALDLAEGFGEGCRDRGLEARLRIGAHLGELTESQDGDLYGDVVNTAARLQGEAEPDQVLVSEDVWRQLRNRRSFVFAEAGARSLKGKDEPVATWVAGRRYARPAATDGAGEARAATGPGRRVVVLPFQVLHPDPEVDFLAFGLPDAVSSSLMGLSSLVVRTPPALGSDGDPIDPREVARAADVDLVLSGSVQRAGDQVRVSARLVDGRRGTLLWNETSTMTVGNLFELQDDLTRRIVDSLAEPLSAEERVALARDVPSSGDAYELYLRANQVAVAGHDWQEGAELYLAALEKDPGYAPAWARLGRCYRLLSKYAGPSEDADADRRRAREAFEKALSINPDLALAHSLYAQLEVESGRPVDALVRLLRRAADHPNEVDLFVGLTHAARYCGLSEVSVAAHVTARQLDPEARTSVAYTHLQTGNAEEALAVAPPDDPVRLYALQSLGWTGEAPTLDEVEGEDSPFHVFEAFAATVAATEAGDVEGAHHHGRRAIDGFPDPEGRYYVARCWAAAGIREAMEVLESAVDGGFYCADGLAGDPMFAGVRDDPSFGALLEQAEAGREAAREAFLQERGPAILSPAAGS